MGAQSSPGPRESEPGLAGLRAALAPLDRALVEHARAVGAGEPAGPPLQVRYDTGEVEELSPAYFFRGGDGLEPVEREAVDRTRGRVLDVGAGVGAVAAAVAGRAGVAPPVTALELLPGAASVLRSRGVARVVEGSLWTVDPAGPFDTVLALMNGTGLAGTGRRLPALLARLGGWVAEGGSLLVDSTDLGDGLEEVQIQLEYRGERGPPFPHLFAGPGALSDAAGRVGWRSTVVARDGDRYLAELRRARGSAPTGPAELPGS